MEKYKVGQAITWPEIGEIGVVVEVLDGAIDVHWPTAHSAAGARSIIEWSEMDGIERLSIEACQGLASRI